MTQQEIQNITLESLRDWFKKEKWVRITTSGNIAGPCGTSKNKKNPDRCLPAAKARSLTKAQRAATARKKKKAGAKGKTVVKNTKAATVKKEGYYSNTQLEDEIRNYGYDSFEQFFADNPGAEEAVFDFIDQNLARMQKETANPQDGKAAPYGSGYKPIKKMKETKGAPAGHYFTKSGNLVKGRLTKDARERGARLSDPKDKQRSKIPPVSQTREDVRNLVVGLMHEMQNESKSYTIDLGNIKSDDLWMIASHLKDATVGGKTGPISDLVAQAADKLEDNQTESINEKDDRCTRIAKRKYDTWPSAYASGAVVRCRRGEIWKGVSEEIDHSETEIKIGDYQTKHYHMCPGAKSLYQDIEDKVDDMDLAVRTAKLQDALFALEMTALEDGATEADLDAAQLIADQIMAMAKMMGLEKEHNYIQGHVDKIEGAIE